MMLRSLLIAAALLAPHAVRAQDDVIAAPTLRANVSVASDIVRIGDVIDNAGAAAQIAIYRAPDLGTTGTLPVAALVNALRTHKVIGVDTRGLRDISVTRLARSLDTPEIEKLVAQTLERRGGLGDAANLALTFDREIQAVQLDASFSGVPSPIAARFEPRSGRFDITFEIGSDANAAPTRLRFTGVAVETVEAAVLTRTLERGEIIKSADLVIERRPKAEAGVDALSRDRALGMQSRRQLRAGQPVRVADLSKPDLVQRDQAVTLIYETAGLYLTIRGKAMENGTEGDVVNVTNLQSKRTVTGTVVGRGQVAVAVATPRPAAVAEAAPAVSLASATSPRSAE